MKFTDVNGKEYEMIGADGSGVVKIRPIQKKQWEVAGLDTTIALAVDSATLEQMKAIKDCVTALMEHLTKDANKWPYGSEFNSEFLGRIDKARELLEADNGEDTK